MGKATRVLAVFSAVIAATLAAPLAHAGQHTIVDATSDMAVPGGDGTVIDSSHSNGDAQQVVVRHTRRAVIITTSFAELNQEDDFINQLVRFKTSTGQQWVQRTNYYPSGLVPDVRTSPGFEYVQCADLQASADTTFNWMRVVIPRSCINRPRWVRVAVTTAHVGTDQTWFDDAHKATAYVQDAWTYTPRIRKPS